METVDKIELKYLTPEDFKELRTAMTDAFTNVVDPSWGKSHILKLIEIFPEGQIVIKVNGKLAGCALSIIVDYNKFGDEHTYREITDNYSFNTHTKKGNVLYGIDVFVKSEYRGMRLGRRMYDYRKELCEQLNLKCIVFGGRLPNYHKFADEISPREYITKVGHKEIEDPVLNFQLSNDFHVKKILKNYLEGDRGSQEYAALLQWDNVYYTRQNKKPDTEKSVIRLGLVQWQMRPYRNMEELAQQVDYFVDVVSGYHCDFVLFPEFFNAPLMAEYNHLSESDAIRELAKYTAELKETFGSLAVTYNINIVTGSMPQVGEDGALHNVGFLCRRDGTSETYIKIHVTPDEAKIWGMQGGHKLQTFQTDCGKIGVLICYDVEFPELSRLLAEEGMNVLFVPFMTDTQNGYSRVRHCSQARAIENECYVAIAGSVGNLPRVHNMDIQFAQSVVFTPCDFGFPTNGITSEATPNTEMILVADVDIDLLKELHEFGSVNNLKDRRKDLYEVKIKKNSKTNALREKTGAETKSKS